MARLRATLRAAVHQPLIPRRSQGRRFGGPIGFGHLRPLSGPSPPIWDSARDALYSALAPVTTVPPVTFTFSRMALLIFSATSGFSLSVCFAASRPCPTSSPR